MQLLIPNTRYSRNGALVVASRWTSTIRRAIRFNRKHNRDLSGDWTAWRPQVQVSSSGKAVLRTLLNNQRSISNQTLLFFTVVNDEGVCGVRDHNRRFASSVVDKTCAKRKIWRFLAVNIVKTVITNLALYPLH